MNRARADVAPSGGTFQRGSEPLEAKNAEPEARPRWQGGARPTVLFAVAVGLALAWVASAALLIIFAGLLLGVALDAMARSLGRILPIRHQFRLAIVVLIVALSLVAVLAWGGTTLALQFRDLVAALEGQIGNLADRLATIGIDLRDMRLRGLLPDAGVIFGGATNAVYALFGGVGNLLVVLFLGVFLATEPGVYQEGLVRLAPRDRRARFSDVLKKAGRAMQGWLFGQSISMAVIFVFTWGVLALIGMPSSFLLALQAGLLVFIPTLGPALAGIVIVLAGLAQGPEMALWGAGTYVLIQLLESNLLTPLVQERTIRLPPAFTLGFQLLMGALFGVLGLALAVPIAAAATVLVEEVYVEDQLGG